MSEDRITLPHKLTLDQRQTLTMTGVSEVVSFDDTAVVLRTQLGILSVHGKELKLQQLSPEGGQVAVSGTVTAMMPPCVCWGWVWGRSTDFCGRPGGGMRT